MDEVTRRQKLLNELETILEHHRRQGASKEEISATEKAIKRIKSKLGENVQQVNENPHTESDKQAYDEYTVRSSRGAGIIIIEGYVRYNGKTFSFDKCSSASNLVEGKVYGIIKEEMLESALMYYLYDPINQTILPGYYNCTWFDDARVKQ